MRLSTASPEPTVRLRSPGEIVSAVPYLIGFAPRSSIVAVGLAGRQITMTCRLDLPDVRHDGLVSGAGDALARAGATSAVLVAYGDSRAACQTAQTRMKDLLAGSGLSVTVQISVVQDRWFDEGCTDVRCCPIEGVPIADHDLAPSTVSFRARAGGYRERADLVAQCHPDQPLLTAAIRAELLQTHAATQCSVETVIEALTEVLGWGSPEPPTVAQLALATLACSDGEVRDTLYAILAPGVVDGLPRRTGEVACGLREAGSRAGDLDQVGRLRDGATRSHVLPRVLTWVRNLPDDVPDATMAALLVAAVAHWSHGEGVKARSLLERAEALDAAPMAMMQTLRACLDHGVRLPLPRPQARRKTRRRPGRGRGGLSVV